MELVHRRIARVITCFAMLLVFLTLQLARIQLVGVVAGRRLGQEAVRQRTPGVPIEVVRGDIYDRNLISLTAGGVRQSVVAFPSITSGLKAGVAPAEWAAWLSGVSAVLGLGVSELDAVLGTPGPPRRLRVNVAPGVAEAVWVANWPGIVAVTEKIRYGPDSLARHLVGYVLPHAYTNPADNLGVAGLEGRYDALLKGRGPELLVACVNAHQELIAGLGYRVQQGAPRDPGHSLILTLDASIQRVVEEVLDSRGINRGAAVVVNPYTGEILAMASRPNYDQNQPHLAFETPGALINVAVSPYQAGSVFKLVVAAAAIEEGLVRLDEKFSCSGEILVASRVFACSHQSRGGHGTISFQDAMAYSCNVAFIQVAQRLGARKLVEYASRFGLGTRTGVEIEREAAGRLPGDLWMGPEALANLALGQGVLEVTPLQMAMVVSALVNDGVMPAPWLVREVRDARGFTLEEHRAPAATRVVSAETARQLRLAMFAVTTYGTGQSAQITYRSAGKTGSAETRPRLPTHAWFAGFAPFYVPRYVMVVFAEQAGAGGVVAAPVFRAVMERLLP